MERKREKSIHILIKRDTVKYSWIVWERYSYAVVNNQRNITKQSRILAGDIQNYYSE